MTNYTDLIAVLHKRGLTNGSALGGHSGLAEEAAAAIEQLVREREALLRALDGNCMECQHYTDECNPSICDACFRRDGWEDKWEWIGVDGG